MFACTHRRWKGSALCARLLSLIVVCGSTALGPRAHAAEPTAAGLNWLRLEGADACIPAAQLAQGVEARVGRPIFASASAAGVFVDGWVRFVAPSGWQVQLGVSDAEGRVLGKRLLELSGDDCHVIDDAVTLVIAVTLYPDTGLPESGIPLDPGTAAKLDALFGAEPTDPDPTALPPATSSAAEATVARSAPRAAASTPASGSGAPDVQPGWQVGVDTTFATGLGQLPGAAFAVAGHVSVTPPDGWPVELGVIGFLPATHDAEGGAAGSGRFDLLLASLAACPTQSGTALSVRLCAGFEAGRIHVEAEGFAEPGPPVDDAIANLFGTVVLRVALGRTPYLRVGLVGLLPLMQRSYTYEGLDGRPERAFRMPQGAARVELGAGASF